MDGGMRFMGVQDFVTMPPLHSWLTMRRCMPRSAANTRTLSLAFDD